MLILFAEDEKRCLEGKCSLWGEFSGCMEVGEAEERRRGPSENRELCIPRASSHLTSHPTAPRYWNPRKPYERSKRFTHLCRCQRTDRIMQMSAVSFPSWWRQDWDRREEDEDSAGGSAARSGRGCPSF